MKITFSTLFYGVILYFIFILYKLNLNNKVMLWDLCLAQSDTYNFRLNYLCCYVTIDCPASGYKVTIVQWTPCPSEWTIKSWKEREAKNLNSDLKKKPESSMQAVLEIARQIKSEQRLFSCFKLISLIANSYLCKIWLGDLRKALMGAKKAGSLPVDVF